VEKQPVNALPPPDDAPGYRTPPVSLDAEASTLGSCFMSKHAVAIVCEELDLQPSDFYNGGHQKVMSAIRKLHQDEEPVDLLSVQQVLVDRGQLEKVGGIAFLMQLGEATPTAAHVRYYGETVREKSTLRTLIVNADLITELAHNSALEASEIVHSAEELIASVALRREAVPIYTAHSLMVQSLASFAPGATRPPTISTGYEALDRMLHGGFRLKELSLIAGRPSMGKSAISVEMSLASARAGWKTGVLSLEMTREKYTARYLSSLAQVNLGHILEGNYRPGEWELVARAGDDFAQLPIVLTDEPALTVQAIRGVLRRMVREHGLQIVFIDQLQCIEPEGKSENANAAITKIVYALQAEAKRLNIHIVLNCQLNRNNEKREEKRPMMSDLRDTGSLEQAARIIIAVHRPDYYQRHLEGQQDTGRGLLDAILLKNDSGGTGSVPLQCDLGICRIWDPHNPYPLVPDPLPHAELDVEEVPPPEDPGQRFRSH
jgi:replicative DNA helicase